MGRTAKVATQLAERRQRVAELYVKAWSQPAIARQLGISQTTVCRDLRAIRQQ
jgi:DNA-binding NarL/FixJ family response regulator